MKKAGTGRNAREPFFLYERMRCACSLPVRRPTCPGIAVNRCESSGSSRYFRSYISDLIAIDNDAR